MGGDGINTIGLPQYVNKKVSLFHIARFRFNAALDGSAWVHKAKYTCSVEIVEDNRQPAIHSTWLYFKRRLIMFEKAGFKQFHIVFDGQPTPLKDKFAKNARNKLHKRARAELDEFKAAGGGSDAVYKGLCDRVAGRMRWVERGLFTYIDSFKRDPNRTMKVTWENAIFEADAVLALRYKTGPSQIIICEDQDIQLYGGKVTLHKLGSSQLNYKAYECDVCDTREWKHDQQVPPCGRGDCKHPGAFCAFCGSAVGLTRAQFLGAAILSGSDYWPGPKNVKLKTACQLMRLHGNLFVALKAQTGEIDYHATYAYQTFVGHYVFNGTMVQHLHPQRLLPGFENAALHVFLGVPPPNSTALAISKGLCHYAPPYDMYDITPSSSSNINSNSSSSSSSSKTLYFNTLSRQTYRSLHHAGRLIS
jgi:5'-3' exonuclease